MRDSLGPKLSTFLVLGGALFVAFAVIIASPFLEKNIKFLVALPMAGLVFMAMVLNFHYMFVMIMTTRCFMDPILEKTKTGEGGGSGIGGILNLFVLMMVVWMALRWPGVLKGNRFVRSWAIFLACAAVTLLYAPLRGQALKLLLTLSTYAAIFSAPFFLIKSEKDKIFWIKLLFFSSLIPVAIANLGVVVHHPMLYVYDRLKGTFTHANILAFYLVLTAALTLYILRTRVIRTTLMMRFFLWIYLLDILVVLIVTETRSAWFSFALFMLLYGLLNDRKLLFVCLLGGAVILMTPQVQKRFEDLSEGTGVRTHEKLNSWAWRMKLWESAMPYIQKKIVMGHGLGSFQEYSKSFFKMEEGAGAAAHNVYIELLFETGIVGLVAFLAIYARLLSTLYKRFRRTRGDISRESALLFSYLAGCLLVFVSDNALYYLAFNWYLWFFVGVIIAAGQLKPPAKIGAS